MREADAFDNTAFLGLARTSKRDPYRLSLFGHHLEPDERPLALLAVHGGTLIVTDGRVLEFRAHLKVHGAWNVKAFQGYVVHRALDREAVRDVAHAVRPTTVATGTRQIEDVLLFTMDAGPTEVLVSRGPQPTLSEDEFRVLREATLGAHPK